MGQWDNPVHITGTRRSGYVAKCSFCVSRLYSYHYMSITEIITFRPSPNLCSKLKDRARTCISLLHINAKLVQRFSAGLPLLGGSGEVFSPVPVPALDGSVCEGQSSLALSMLQTRLLARTSVLSIEIPLCIPLAVRSHQSRSCLLCTA